MFLSLQRYHKHARMSVSAPKPSSHDELLQNFPKIRAARSLGEFVAYLFNFTFINIKGKPGKVKR